MATSPGVRKIIFYFILCIILAICYAWNYMGKVAAVNHIHSQQPHIHSQHSHRSTANSQFSHIHRPSGHAPPRLQWPRWPTQSASIYTQPPHHRIINHHFALGHLRSATTSCRLRSLPRLTLLSGCHKRLHQSSLGTSSVCQHLLKVSRSATSPTTLGSVHPYIGTRTAPPPPTSAVGTFSRLPYPTCLQGDSLRHPAGSAQFSGKNTATNLLSMSI